MTTPPLYRIVGYSDHFENSKSRVRQQCSFVCVPNKHGGVGLGNVMGQPDGAAIYGIWMWILQNCSRQRPPREGWLTQDGKKNGRRLSARELANLFRRPIEEIHRTLQVLTLPEVAFMELVEGQAEYIIGEHRTDTAGATDGHRADTGWALEPESVSESDTIPDGPAADTEGAPDGHHGILSETPQCPERKKERKKESLSKGQGNEEKAGIGWILGGDSADTGRTPDGHRTDSGKLSASPTEAGPDVDLVQHAEAKRLITDLAKERFQRSLTEADWRRPQWDFWLDEAMPITQVQWNAVNWFYRLSDDHEIFKTTARVQSVGKFLERLPDEIDKALTARKKLGLNGQYSAKVDDSVPADWTQTARELYGEINFPKRRSQVAESVQREIAAHIAKKGLPK